MKEIKLTRQELYDLVWIEPIQTLSKKYIISDSDLRKECIKMGIPLPDSGYWSKIRYGKKVIKLKLSDDYIGDEYVILLLREIGDENVMPEKSTLSVLQKEIENDPRVKLKVPDKLTNPDKLIVSVRDNFSKGPSNYHSRGLARSPSGELDLRININNLNRSLRFMDTLIKAFKARGHEIKIQYDHTCLYIFGEKFEIYIRELTKRVIIKGKYYDSSRPIPIGNLVFIAGRYYPSYEWKDGKKSIEDQISIIITKLEIVAKRLVEENIIHERKRLIEAEIEHKMEELQKRKEKELHDFKVLIKTSKRRYCTECENEW